MESLPSNFGDSTHNCFSPVALVCMLATCTSDSCVSSPEHHHWRTFTMKQDQLRKLWRCYCRASEAYFAAYRANGYRDTGDKPEFPEELRHLQCGAKTRAGTPCKSKTIYSNGRCKLHGGLSTGPKTKKGKKQSRLNGQKGGRPTDKPIQNRHEQTQPHELLTKLNIQRELALSCGS